MGDDLKSFLAHGAAVEWKAVPDEISQQRLGVGGAEDEIRAGRSSLGNHGGLESVKRVEVAGERGVNQLAGDRTGRGQNQFDRCAQLEGLGARAMSEYDQRDPGQPKRRFPSPRSDKFPNPPTVRVVWRCADWETADPAGLGITGVAGLRHCAGRFVGRAVRVRDGVHGQARAVAPGPGGPGGQRLISSHNRRSASSKFAGAAPPRRFAITASPTTGG